MGQFYESFTFTSSDEFPLTCLLYQKSQEVKRAIVLLHGYAQTASDIIEPIQSIAQEGDLLIAPNGPFLMPKKGRSGYQARHAWYFYDHTKNFYFIRPEFAANMVSQALDQLGKIKSETPSIAIGFSQGGYLLPFLAHKSKRIGQIIGIACKFRHPIFGFKLNGLRVDGIHHQADPLVDCKESIQLHSELLNQGNTGNFYQLPGASHEINEGVLEVLKKILTQR